jgi:hypothetical protein
MMDDLEMLKTMQAEAAIWTRYNFPDQRTYQPLLGMVEELGELWDAETTSLQLDALADMLIFATNFCTHLGLDVVEVWQHRRPFSISGTQGHARAMSSALGRVAHCQLKQEQGIRGDQETHRRNLSNELGALFSVLDDRARSFGEGVVALAFRVWREEVKPRNWRPIP